MSDTPSKKNIAVASIVVFLLAGALLVTVILPAEYGIDPLGTGRALGLLDLSEAAAEPAAAADQGDAHRPGFNVPQPRIYKVDTRDIPLEPREGLEIKYHMEKGAVMVHAWRSTGPVMFEFHGEPDQKPNKEYYDSYELDDKVGKTESYGSFTAPSTGIQGWFFENKGKRPVTVHLTTAGFYDSAKKFSAHGIEHLEVFDVK